MTSNRYEITDEIHITDQITTDDIPSMVKYLNNPKIYANTLAIPHPYTEKEGEDFLKMIQSSSLETSRHFAIRLNNSNEMIGACGFFRSEKNPRSSGIGYWLAEPYWGRGLMPKVVSKAIEIAKNQWTNLVRIEAHIYTWNKPSTRVVEKSGFQCEGILQKYYYKDSQDTDVYSYAYIFP